MHITRVQVEEGFLDGLDLEFTPGLNVIIGARGTGKTSIIELLRFALGVESFTASAAKTSHEHVLAVLGDGRVKVSVTQNGVETHVTRSAGDAPKPGIEPTPLIFSQTEIETLGLNPASRLKLIDGFVDWSEEGRGELSDVLAIRSLTNDVAARRQEIESYREELEIQPELENELKQLAGDEASISKASAEAAEKNKSLNEISERLSRFAVFKDENSRLQAMFIQRRQLLSQALDAWGEKLPRSVTSGTLEEADAAADRARSHVETAISELTDAIRSLKELEGNLAEKVEGEEQLARDLRRSVEEITEGAGRIASQTQSLRSRIARLQSLRSVLVERERALEEIIGKRAAALDQLETIREAKFERRRSIAEMLSNKLGPRIQVLIERAGLLEPYAAVIANLLRGSGLRYNELSRSIAEVVSPRELAEYVEQGDAQSLAAATNIPRDRAEKCIASFRDASAADQLFTLQVEDRIDFYLLDQSIHKAVSELSMGQRCTVVLPIVLERRGRVLIVDQPEDHIDNAFIAETLIRAIADRSAGDQIILTTHNANIPVLGDASLVVQMGSDGKRGFVVVAAPLDDDAAVNAITSIMEGGREAFAQRASFYAQHP